jgi:uncharacterized tellurite resistance protein B-like protein
MNLNSIQEQLSGKLFDLFDNVINERKEFYKENIKPTKDQLPSLISKYSNKSAAISGAANLAPGPYGLLTAIPELVLVVRNQIQMVYDIGAALDKDKVMNREIIVSLVFNTIGNATISFIVINGSKILIRRSSLRVFQKVVLALGIEVTQKILKSKLVGAIPVLGVGAMAIWSKYSTNKIGEKAKELFKCEIELQDNEEAEDMEITSETNNTNPPFIENKIMILINLLKADNFIHDIEKEYLTALIESSDLNDDIKNQFLKSFDTKTNFEIDFQIFSSNHDEAIGLIADMIALAKRDGEFHKDEELYIKTVAKQIGVSEKTINMLLDL